MAEETTTVETKKEVTGKTVLSFKLPTPMWATWVFRSVYWVSFGFSMWIGTTHVIPEANKVEIILTAAVIDRIIWGIARGVGFKKETFEDEGQ